MAEPSPSLLPIFGSKGGEFTKASKDDHLIKGWLPAKWIDNSKWAAVNATYTKLAESPDQDLAEVRTVLQQSNFANLPKVQPAKGADLFTYQVIYGGDQILAVDGGIDERLKPVIGTLSGLMAKYSA